MGIYIKDFKMPMNCDDCLLGSDCPYDQSIDGYKMQGGRPRSCPLVHVPPHGRLIDADALEDNNITYYAIPVLANVTDAAIREAELVIRLKDLDAAPTVIPAEENLCRIGMRRILSNGRL